MLRLSRLFYTLVYLKPMQLAFFIWRRKFSARTVHKKKLLGLSANGEFSLASPIAVDGGVKNEGLFEFLNISQRFDAVDWTSDGKPRLWSYNLHYFDYLRNETVSVDYRFSLIDSWIKNNKENTQPGWEPFTMSLRIVNWIFFFSKKRSLLSSGVLNGLYLQALWLEQNDERHILANHYFENLKALLFAGCFFEGNDAKRWREKAISELATQLKEQMLGDGGHYERSPQYHCLMLENYLDIYNLVDRNSEFFSSSFKLLVGETSEKALKFLSGIVFPDKQIPLFNDSAFGVAPTLDALESYAKHLFAYEPSQVNDTVIQMDETGLYGIRRGLDMLLMDCGDIGPGYQPGHTHCDFLSYELMRDGQRVIVDTGVCEYAPGETRKYLRSTSAHNTVVVNGLEQSEVWGEFRVARRARKVEAVVEESDGLVSLRGSFNGFYASRFHWKPDFSHARQIDVKLLKDSLADIRVCDKIRALKGSETSISAESYVHFHPDILLQELSNDGQSGFAILRGERVVAQLRFSSVFQYEVQDGIYCPEFGRKERNKCLVLSADGVGTLEIGYSIVFT